MAFAVPEKKAVLVAFDLAALAACVAAAFELVAKVPALSALEVSSQAFWSKIFELLLLFVAYLNDCMDITRLRSAWRYLRRWWAACAVTAVIYLFVFFLFGRSPASGGGGAAIPRVVPIPTLALAAFVVPIARLTVERWLELSSRR